MMFQLPVEDSCVHDKCVVPYALYWDCMCNSTLKDPEEVVRMALS
jgi:hypothetical protein